MTKLEKILIFSLVGVIVILTGVLFLRPEKESEEVVGDFVPPSFDAAAVAGEPEPDRPGYGTLQLTDEIAVSLYASPLVQDGRAQVFFASPASNTAWVRLRLLDTKGNLLGETGLIRPGEYVESVSISALPKQSEAVARILTYEPETYYSLGSAGAQLMLQYQK